jgi:hypothetical protein
VKSKFSFSSSPDLCRRRDGAPGLRKEAPATACAGCVAARRALPRRRDDEHDGWCSRSFGFVCASRGSRKTDRRGISSSTVEVPEDPVTGFAFKPWFCLFRPEARVAQGVPVLTPTAYPEASPTRLEPHPTHASASSQKRGSTASDDVRTIFATDAELCRENATYTRRD